MNKRKIYLMSLAALTVLVAAAVFIGGYILSARSAAKPRLNEAVAEVKKNSADIQAVNDDLQSKIDDADTELSTEDTVNNYYMEYKKTHDSLENEVVELKKQNAALDDELSKKEGSAGEIEGLNRGTTGNQYALKKDKSYACPKDVPAGRYTAKGKGTFAVITSEGKARVSQNLDVSYDNSYTFNLSDGESIKTGGDVTLTELK